MDQFYAAVASMILPKKTTEDNISSHEFLKKAEEGGDV